MERGGRSQGKRDWMGTLVGSRLSRSETATLIGIPQAFTTHYKPVPTRLHKLGHLKWNSQAIKGLAYIYLRSHELGATQMVEEGDIDWTEQRRQVPIRRGAECSALAEMSSDQRYLEREKH